MRQDASRSGYEWLGQAVFFVCVQSYKKESPQPLSGAGVRAPAGGSETVAQGVEAAESRLDPSFESGSRFLHRSCDCQTCSFARYRVGGGTSLRKILTPRVSHSATPSAMDTTGPQNPPLSIQKSEHGTLSLIGKRSATDSTETHGC